MIAKNLREIRKVIDPKRPLETKDDFKKYYVDTHEARSTDVTARLKELLEDERDSPQKILLTGHKGCGKSTELNYLADQLKDIYFVVSFKAWDELDIYNFSYLDLILVMINKVYEKVSGTEFSKNLSIIKPIHNWFYQEITKEKVIIKELEAEIGGGGEVGIPPTFFGKLLAKIAANMKYSTTTKDNIRTIFEKRFSSLLTHVNNLITQVNTNLTKDGKRLLVIVEDLDKIEDRSVSEEFFCNRCLQLTNLEIHVIYTFPIHLLNRKIHLNECYDDVYTLPMVKINGIDGKSFKLGRDCLREIVKRRVDVDACFEKGILDDLLEHSGGVIRHLFLMIITSSSIAKTKGKSKVDKESAKEAILSLKNDLRDALVETYDRETNTKITAEQQFEKLVKVKDSTKKIDIDKDKILSLLLQNLCVLEFNGERWADIHPVVKLIMQDRGL